MPDTTATPATVRLAEGMRVRETETGQEGLVSYIIRENRSCDCGCNACVVGGSKPSTAYVRMDCGHRLDVADDYEGNWGGFMVIEEPADDFVSLGLDLLGSGSAVKWPRTARVGDRIHELRTGQPGVVTSVSDRGWAYYTCACGHHGWTRRGYDCTHWGIDLVE